MRGRRGVPRCVTMTRTVAPPQCDSGCTADDQSLLTVSEPRFALRVKLSLLPSPVCLCRTAGPGPFSIHTIPSLLTVYGEI